MKLEKNKVLTLLLVIISVASLTACVNGIKANGGIAVEAPYKPKTDKLTEGDVGVLLIEQDAALQQCNANFSPN